MTASIALKDYGDRESWLASRTATIGASEVAGLFSQDGVSLSPFTTCYALWLEKTGQIAPQELDAEIVEFGNLMEPIARELYQKRTGRKVWQGGPFQVAEHPRIPRLRTTPDGWVTEAPDRSGDGLLQCKNAGEFVAKDWADGPPQYVQIQTQAEMAVTGRDWDSVATVLGGNRFRYWDQERHADFIAEIEEQVSWFFGMVDSRTAPPIDGSAKTLEAIQRMHPDDNGKTVRLPEEAVEWLDILESAKARAKEAEAEEKAAKSKLLVAIGAATFGELPDGRVLSLKTQERAPSMTSAAKFRVLRSVNKPRKDK